MTIEVLGAGFGRTGTMSLKVALEELGVGPCYHMIELFGHPEHVELWEAASQGKAVNWDELFSGYRATTDWPACSFYEELMEKYTDAKVILTVRNPDRWYESTYNTIYGMRRMISSPIFRLAAPLRPGLRRAAKMNDHLIWDVSPTPYLFFRALADASRGFERAYGLSHPTSLSGIWNVSCSAPSKSSPAKNASGSTGRTKLASAPG
jgi:Sulfotransferase domain